jgi:hypothetical protein
MGHYCGARNTTTPGYCARWLVNYQNCFDHREGFRQHQRGSWDERASDVSAELLVQVLTEGIQDTAAERVTDYLGKVGTWMLRRHRWQTAMCQDLAVTAKAVLDLKDKPHQFMGIVAASMLPPETPRFNVKLVEKIAARVPLPWDSHLLAVARGLQIIGIFECTVKGMPVTSCACLRMFGSALLGSEINDQVKDLLDAGSQDLRTAAGGMGIGPTSSKLRPTA